MRAIAAIERGVLVASIGATLPEHLDIDPEAIATADLIVADIPHEVMEETGCFIAAKRAGVTFGEKFVSLNSLMTGKADGPLQATRPAHVPPGRSLFAGFGRRRARLASGRGARAGDAATGSRYPR